MGSIVRLAAVNTKVKAMEGKFLSKEQYLSLIEKKTYFDAVRYLKEETYYSSILSSYNVEEDYLGQLEIILKNSYTEKFFKLMHFFNSDYKKLFNILFIKNQGRLTIFCTIVKVLKIVNRPSFIKLYLHSFFLNKPCPNI